jgi:hypothetical protein
MGIGGTVEIITLLRSARGGGEQVVPEGHVVLHRAGSAASTEEAAG